MGQLCWSDPGFHVVSRKLHFLVFETQNVSQTGKICCCFVTVLGLTNHINALVLYFVKRTDMTVYMNRAIRYVTLKNIYNLSQ